MKKVGTVEMPFGQEPNAPTGLSMGGRGAAGMEKEPDTLTRPPRHQGHTRRRQIPLTLGFENQRGLKISGA